jgi:hypothetical protein
VTDAEMEALAPRRIYSIRQLAGVGWATDTHPSRPFGGWVRFSLAVPSAELELLLRALGAFLPWPRAAPEWVS